MNFETLRRLKEVEDRLAELERRLQDVEAATRPPDVREAVAILEREAQTRKTLSARKRERHG